MKYKTLHTRSFFLVLAMLQFTSIHAQDITGYWQGRFRTDQRLNGRSETFFMNMVLNRDGRKIEGQFYTAPLAFPDKPTIIYQVSALLGKKEKVPPTIMRDVTLYSRIPEQVADYFRSLEEIKYLRNDTIEILYGNWQANGLVPLRDDGYAGSFWLGRRIVKNMHPQDTLGLAASVPAETNLPIPVQMTSRKKAEQGNITINTNKITIQLYDNGEEDGDTVSIFLDGKMLLTHQRIAVKPITLDVELDKTPGTHELVLFAENLGSIAPNTALVIVSAGNNRYQLFSCASLEANAVLQINYQPNQ